MTKRLVVSLFTLALGACGGGSAAPQTPTAPTAPTTTVPPATLVLSGLVSDSTATSRYADGLPEATVSITDGPNAGKSAMADSAGRYIITGLQPGTFTVTASYYQDRGYFTGPITMGFPFVPLSKTVTLTSNQTLNFALDEQCFYQFAKDPAGLQALPLPRARVNTAPGVPVTPLVKSEWVVQKLWGDASCRWSFASSEPWVTMTPVTSGVGGEAVAINIPLSPVPVRCASTVLFTAITQSGVTPRYHRVDIFSFGLNNTGDLNFCDAYYAQF